jgi:hypothetical protein
MKPNGVNFNPNWLVDRVKPRVQPNPLIQPIKPIWTIQPRSTVRPTVRVQPFKPTRQPVIPRNPLPQPSRNSDPDGDASGDIDVHGMGPETLDEPIEFLDNEPLDLEPQALIDEQWGERLEDEEWAVRAAAKMELQNYYRDDEFSDRLDDIWRRYQNDPEQLRDEIEALVAEFEAVLGELIDPGYGDDDRDDDNWDERLGSNSHDRRYAAAWELRRRYPEIAEEIHAIWRDLSSDPDALRRELEELIADHEAGDDGGGGSDGGGDEGDEGGGGQDGDDGGDQDGDDGNDFDVEIIVPGLGPVIGAVDYFGYGRPDVIPDGYVWGPGYLVPAEEPPGEARTIVLLNPEENANPVTFQLSGQPQMLEAGQELQFEASQAVMIEYDRGGGFGRVRYSLTGGVYEFKLTERGWQLFRRTFTVTLDNSTNASDFRYVANGQQAVVAGGQTRTHVGPFPLVVSFDPGNGGEPAQVALPSGTYMIGVNPESGLWDLFLAAETE